MKRIVVTGAAGFIGSRLVAGLNRKGISDILAVDNAEKSAPLRNLAQCKFADYLHSAEFLDRFDGGVEAILHQGACTNTLEYDRQFMMESNYGYSRRLLEKCQAAGVPLIYASSAAVYGGGREFREEPGCERPLNVYGESKLEFDRLVRGMLPQARAQVAGLRYFNVYGPNEAHKQTMASMAFHGFNQFRQAGRIRLFAGSGGYADGEQRRDFIYVDDLVAVNLWFLEQRAVSGVFNCGTGRAQSFNELAAAVINAVQGTRLAPPELAAKSQIEYIPFPDGLMEKYQSFTEADLTRLRGAGYAGEFRNVEQGVASYVKELQRP